LPRERRPTNVEIGTSYGVSTLYLAAAIRDNARAHGGDGVVIGTEFEPHKASAARAHFKQAGLSHFIDLREGDLRETLKEIDGPVDFLLIDIWIAMARPALELVAPHLRPGALVLCDNTEQYRNEYADYFAFLANPANGFSDDDAAVRRGTGNVGAMLTFPVSALRGTCPFRHYRKLDCHR